jgi:hypothetical protein
LNPRAFDIRSYQYAPAYRKPAVINPEKEVLPFIRFITKKRLKQCLIRAEAPATAKPSLLQIELKPLEINKKIHKPQKVGAHTTLAPKIVVEETSTLNYQ